MATLLNGWYKGSIPFYEITEVSVATTGSGSESWENDGIICYRNGTKVTIVCDNMTAIGDKAFFKFIALKNISGLSSVTTIGAYAFCYTPNIMSIDLIPSNLTSIGVSAFRMSSAEDSLDLSTVSLDIIGDKATRLKRWGTGLTAVQNVVFPKTIYLDVPNSENQSNYPDIPFGTDNGENLTVANGGCSALACYHIWNYIHAGTNKQYGNWLDWYNSTINKDGDFADNNMMDSNFEPSMITKLGWTDLGNTKVADASQLQIILDRLAIGYPTHITMYSVNDPNYGHCPVIIGCDAKTHKLAVIDSNVVGTSGIVSWLSFEDIFVGGNTDQDRIRIIDYNLPVLAPNSTWFTQGGTSVSKSSITEINVKDTYTPNGTVTASWDASAAKDGSIMAYVEGSNLTLAGNGAGKICMNADSSHAFDGFSQMTSFNGAVLSSGRVTTFEKTFYDCMALKVLDLCNWNTSNVESLNAMFNGMLELESINVGTWNTVNVTNMQAIFQCDVKLTELNLSNWKTDSVTNLYAIFGGVASYGGPMSLTKIAGLENWDTSKVTNMKSAFQNCNCLKTLDISNWNTGACTDMSYMFSSCTELEELNVSNWDTSKVTNMISFFHTLNNLKIIKLGEKFSFNGNGSLTGNKVATLPTPNSANIPGADGNWYDVNGNAIAPSDVPGNKFGVYYATPAIAEEDMNQMVLVNKKNLMRTAAAIRTKLGSGKAYTHAEFADVILEIQ